MICVQRDFDGKHHHQRSILANRNHGHGGRKDYYNRDDHYFELNQVCRRPPGQSKSFFLDVKVGPERPTVGKIPSGVASDL